MWLCKNRLFLFELIICVYSCISQNLLAVKNHKNVDSSKSEMS